MRRRRIGAYGVCRDENGRTLLVRLSASSIAPGCWGVPGGGVEHGEHPADAVVRELREETGLEVEIACLRDVDAAVVTGGNGRPDMHYDRIFYDVRVVGGTLRHERDGTTDRARWVPPQEIAGLALMPPAARALGHPHAAVRLEEIMPAPGRSAPDPVPGPDPRPRPARGQRFAAYGLVTDPAGRVLLTRNAPGYPGAGRWHLPGGGTDFGEQPADGLLRELHEETDQIGRITGLLDVSHEHRAAALGPEGYPIDWHSVRAVFRVAVDHPTLPVVNDLTGSTAEAAWFDLTDVASLALTTVASVTVSRVVRGSGPR